MVIHVIKNAIVILSFTYNVHALGIPKGDACVTKRSKNYHEFIMNIMTDILLKESLS